MSARRALLDDLGEIELAVRAEGGRARRALAEQSARRALIEDTPASTCARRAMVEFDLVEEPATRILPKQDAVAFVTPRRRFTARKLIAAAGVVAVAGTFSGAALARSAAEPAVTTAVAATPQAGERDLDISRDAARPVAPVATTSPAADAPTTPVPTAEETPEAGASATAEPTPEPTPEPIDIAGTIAPGQLAPRSVDEAMATAASMVGNWGYDNMCLSLVATFYGYSSSGEIGAQQAANTIMAAGQMHTDMSDIPVGALIWYDGTPVGNPYGHVAMYAGDGMVYSNGAPTGVGLIPLYEPAEGWGEPVIGWSTVWLPAATK